MADHDELEAMKMISDALEPLDTEARQRALSWAASRFLSGRKMEAPGGQVALPLPESGGFPTSDGTVRFDTFAELFDAANPDSDREKALVAAYWQQVCESLPSFASQAVNTGLKDLGHGVGNITEALTALKNDRPALVLQLKKSGTSKQARKTYKLTQEGIRRVNAMIRTSSGDGEDT